MAERALEHAIAVEQHRVASAQIRLLRFDAAVEAESTFGDERSLDDHGAVELEATGSPQITLDEQQTLSLEVCLQRQITRRMNYREPVAAGLAGIQRIAPVPLNRRVARSIPVQRWPEIRPIVDDLTRGKSDVGLCGKLVKSQVPKIEKAHGIGIFK